MRTLLTKRSGAILALVLLLLLPAAVLGQSITVTIPAGGEVWTPGSTQTITWTYSGNVGTKVTIQLLQGGALNSTLATGAPIGTSGSGSFAWAIPAGQAQASNYQIKLTTPGGNGTVSVTNTSNFFSILAVSISVTSPIGGEVWNAGTTHNITWSYAGSPGSAVSITLLKGGVVDSTITASTPIGASGTGSFAWTIPGTQAQGSNYQVRIASTSSSVSGTSPSNFTINGPSITVTSPNGGEIWPLSSPQTITWSYVGDPGANVKVDLLKGGVLNTVLAASTPIGASGTGSLAWTVPANQAQGTDYTVRVTSTTNSAFTDSSNAAFTIGTFYNLGVSLTGTGTGSVASSPAGINCGSSCSANFAGGTQVTLTESPAANNTFAGWGGACLAAGTNSTCTVTMNQAQSVSAGFTAPPTSISITAPNGGESWTAGTTQAITWSYTGNPGSAVSLTLLKGGVVNSTITASTPIGSSGTGSFSWAIPAAQTQGSDYTVQITSTTNSSYTSTSAGPFTINGTSIAVTSPASGVSWGAGTTQTISWTYSGNVGSAVSIQLLNNGSLVSTITSSTSVGSGGTGSFSWLIPKTQAAGTNYSIKVISTSNTAIFGTSAAFTILGPGITVTSPAGGEGWSPGTTHSITWTYSGSVGSSVNIQLLQGGALNTAISSAASIGSNGNGSFSWSIPAGQAQASNYQIKLTTSGGNGATIVSNTSNFFSIATNPTISGFTPNSGGWGTPVTISGSNFSTTPANNTVTFNGTAAVVSSATSTSISTSVPQGATTGLIAVTTATGSATSASSFTVQNPVPSVTSVNPTSVSAGSATTVVTVSGANFIPGSVVQLDGSGVSTTYVSSTQLSATVPASSLVSPHIFTVTVFNPAPGGGTSANSASFSVVNPTPTISAVNPSVVNVGAPDTAITVSGTGYVSSSVINLNGSLLTTAFNSSTSLGATVPAASMTSAASLPVTVVTPGPGGGTSNSVNFIVSPVSASTSTVSASPTTGVTADGVATSTITVTVKDANGNPSANQTVTLSSTGSGNTITQPSSPTNGSGVATGTIASTKAQTKTITATVTTNPGRFQVALNQQPTVQFVGNAATISATNSSASANPTTQVPANGSTTSTITVTVRDANNNPVPGQAVQLAATGSGNILVQPPATDSTGTTSGTIASTVSETKTITVTVNPGGTPVVLSTQPTVTFFLPPTPRYAFVPNKNDNTVSVYSVNASSGQLRAVSYATTGTSPAAVATDPGGKFLYVANSGSGNVFAFTIGASGTLTPVTGSPFAAGTTPVALTTDPAGQFLYVANRGSNNISVYSINGTTGALTAGTAVAAGTAPVALVVEASGAFLYAANNGSGNVSGYSVGVGGALTSLGAPFAAGTSPVSIATDGSGSFVYVANAGTSDISMYDIAGGGALSGFGSAAAPATPTAITLDPSGDFAYVSTSTGVSAYSITSGTLGLLGSVAAGTSPSGVRVDPSGEFVYVSNSGSNDISRYTINGDGTLSAAGSMRARVAPAGIAVSRGAAAVSYASKFAYAANNGSGNVSMYSVNATSGALTSLGAIVAGNSARGVAVHPSGKFVYAANQGSSTVTIYTVNQSTGALTAAGSAGSSSPFGIAIEPSGRFAYVSNSQGSTVTVYSINPSTGALTFLSSPTTISSPRRLTVDPTGRFLLVAGNGGSIASHAINPVNGSLAAANTVSTSGQFFEVSVDSTGRFAYGANKGTSQISAFSINASTGALSGVGSVGAGTDPRSVTVTLGGNFAYAANYNFGSGTTLSLYTVNTATGALTAAGTLTTGMGPIQVVVDPSGKFLYVVCGSSNAIYGYTIGSNGSLTPVSGSPAPTGTTPHSMAILPQIQ